MAVNNQLGRVGFVPRPDYTPGLECFPLDAVNYKNTLWACIAQTTETPGPDSQNWVPMLSLAASLAAGGGVIINSEGLLEVDFSKMPADKFNKLLSTLKVPIWLTANTVWYVDPVNGSDSFTVDQIAVKGRTEASAFKNLQTAVDFVASNFNFGNYAGRIYILGDVTIDSPDKTLRLPGYAAGSGNFGIYAPEKCTLEGFIQCAAGLHFIHNISIKGPSNAASESGIAGLVKVTAPGHVYFGGCDFDTSQTDGQYYHRIFCAYGGGHISIYGDSPDETVPTKITGKFDRVFEVLNSGSISVGANIDFDLVTNSANKIEKYIIVAYNSALWARARNIESAGYACGTVSGSIRVQGADVFYRFHADTNSIINTAGGGGDAFMPWGKVKAPLFGGQIV